MTEGGHTPPVQHLLPLPNPGLVGLVTLLSPGDSPPLSSSPSSEPALQGVGGCSSRPRPARPHPACSLLVRRPLRHAGRGERAEEKATHGRETEGGAPLPPPRHTSQSWHRARRTQARRAQIEGSCRRREGSWAALPLRSHRGENWVTTSTLGGKGGARGATGTWEV